MLSINGNQSCLAVILICALTSGCVSRSVYGESWAEQVTVESDDCPVIDGVYQNAGEWFSKGKKGHLERIDELSLAHIVNGGYDSEAFKNDNRLGTTFHKASKDEFQTVSLRLADGKLHVEASLAEGGTRTFDLQTRQQCRHSTLLLKAADTSGDIDWTRQSLALGRAKDGSLLVYWSGTTVIFILGPNLAWHDSSVIRFPPVAPTTK